jgi:prepilin-type N-terminal cleavage/methylation domain-containing protein
MFHPSAAKTGLENPHMIRQPQLSQFPTQAHAFTLIEMLVTILIIGILAAILLPVLANAKKAAQQTYCINNMHEFNLALRMYADDNLNIFIPFVNGSVTYQAGGYYVPPTLAGNNDFSGVSSTAALQNCEQALQNCLLFPYVKNTKIFVCPGDTRVTLTPGNGFAYCTYSKTQNFAGDAYDNYWGMGANCEKDADVDNPVQTFDIVEDTDWRGYNDGTWVVTWDLASSSFTWIDPLAMYHVNANNWGYLDGHVASHAWQDQAAVAAGQQAAKGQQVIGFPAATTGPDYDFVQSGLRFPGWQMAP